jgi:hypothetical protein
MSISDDVIRQSERLPHGNARHSILTAIAVASFGALTAVLRQNSVRPEF